MAKIKRAPKVRTFVTEEMQEALDDIGEVILREYSSFTMQDLYRFGSLRDCPPETIDGWAPVFLRTAIETGFIEKVEGCYDAPIYKRIKIPDRPTQKTKLYNLASRGKHYSDLNKA